MKTNLLIIPFFAVFCFAAHAAETNAGGNAPVSASLGLQTDIVLDSPQSGSFTLEQDKQATPIFIDQADWPGVIRAGTDLQADVERVTGIKPTLTTNSTPLGKFAVIIGTIGKSPLIDGLVKSGKINVGAISNQWESFVITTVANPLPSVNGYVLGWYQHGVRNYVRGSVQLVLLT